jgi:hypothetical protein
MTSRPKERGSVTVAAIAAMAIAGVMILGVARVGAAAVLRARADNAADAAALAAAAADAARTARDNGARLMSCDCGGTTAEVVVAVTPSPRLHIGHDVIGRARADVDYAAQFTGS